MNTEIDPYPDAEFPWHFYFDGVPLPKWGALWGMLPRDWFEPEKDWDEVIGHRDVVLISYRLDHVGVVESADPAVFTYAVQEVLYKLLTKADEALAYLRSDGRYPAEELYEGLVTAAFQMRALVTEHKIAFWTSGYEADRLRVAEAMERACLPCDDPRFKAAPHLQNIESMAKSRIKLQRTKLHQLAQSGAFKKEWRKLLHSV